MQVRRSLISVHRWLGVVICLFMAAWFASGAVMIYVPFPSLSASDRLERSGEADLQRLEVSPAGAIQTSGARLPVDRIRLIARGGRPLYVVNARGEDVRAVWADDGSAAALQAEDEAREIATAFSGEPAGRIDGPVDYDQWVVHQGFDSQRPFYRVHMDDSAQTVLYVSQRSGEVVQRTTRAQRGWNYVGAVVHWIYPTVLRQHWALWDRLVWWLSLAGIVVVAIGAVLGVDHLLAALRARRGRISPFRDWMKWHHVLGLGAFVFTLTWIFSGWLSMDHGRIFSVPDPTPQQVDRFRGIPVDQAARRVSVDFIRQLGAFRELEIKSVAGTPVIVVRSDTHRLIDFTTGLTFPGGALPADLVRRAVQSAWPDFTIRAMETVAPDDVYGKVRQDELPPATKRLILDDPGNTWVHVDVASAEIVTVTDRGRRVYRWLYDGLHSLDFPGLVDRRPLWDVIILSLLAIGFAFSITGVVLGVKRLRWSFAKSPRDR